VTYSKWRNPPAVLEGGIVRAQVLNQALQTDLSLSVHRLAHKTADESVPSSTTLQDDDHLFFTVGVNELWFIHLHMFYVCATSSVGIKLGFSHPTDADARLQAYAMNENEIDFIIRNYTTDSPGFISSSNWRTQTANNALSVRGMLFTVSEGTFRVRWAQATSAANPVIVRANSSIQGVKVGPNPQVAT